ncbi:hypothetical protein [Massilia putida]|uniref:hypothetical protein n=1 Tax=Massilia putida TaxID=1141883 RepID=UPI0012EBCECB|nr:hypothetical protein [Massilia putida]
MFVAICTNNDNRVMAYGAMMGNNNGNEPDEHGPYERARDDTWFSADLAATQGGNGRNSCADGMATPVRGDGSRSQGRKRDNFHPFRFFHFGTAGGRAGVAADSVQSLLSQSTFNERPAPLFAHVQRREK